MPISSHLDSEITAESTLLRPGGAMANNPALQPMFDWLNGVPIADLAAELMAAFSSDPKGWEYARTIMCKLFAAHGYPKPRLGLGRPDYWPIEEAMQLLEHSEMVFKMASEQECWRATRLGLATFAAGKDAVRQRIKDRTGL
jgi:hypothetical protein